MQRKTQFTALMSLVIVLVLAGRQSSNQQPENATPGSTAAGGAKGGGARESGEVNVTVPAGTTLSLRLSDSIDTGKTPEGASFEGTLAAALVAGGVEVAPLGSKVTGKVTNVVSSGRLNRPAELSLVLTSLTPTGADTIDISTSAWSTKGESHKKRNIEMIGGGAGAGVLIGALTGGKKGAGV